MNVKTKILILEHDPINIHFLESELDLSLKNYTAHIVQTEAEFQEALHDFAPDIILSDYSHPAFDWNAAFQLKQKVSPRVPFILVSGPGEGEDTLELIKNGVTDYVFKSKPASLVPKIKRALTEAGKSNQQITEQLALQKSIANLRAIFEHTEVGFLFLDTDYKVVAYNHISSHWAANVFGIELKENADFKLLLLPERLAEFNTFGSSVLSGTDITYEATYPKEDGSLMCLIVSGTPIKEDEKTIGMCIAITDITARKEAEEKLKKNEAKLNEAQAIAHVGSWEIDIALNIHTWSDELYHIFGIEKTPPSQQLFMSFIHPDDRPFAIANMQRSVETQSDSFFDFRFIRHDGVVRFGYSEWKCEVDETGKTVRVYGIVQDITERKKAEQELSQSLKEVTDYKFALDEASIVAITDQKGTINYVNDNFCKISKYSREELIGQDHRIINSGYHTKEFIKKIWTTITRGKVWRGEIKNKAKDGTYYWVDTTIIPFLNEQGKPYQYVSIRADITERKKSEQDIIELNESLESKVKERTAQLQEINNDLESFGYSVSHDLRSPLQVISGYSSILSKKYNAGLDEEAQELLQGIKTYTKQMSLIMESLLNLSRLGRAAVEKTTCRTNEMVKAVVAELKKVNKDAPVEIKVQHMPNAGCDSGLLKQVWVNLISNAVKYSKKKEKVVIEIGANEVNGEVVYYVKDNGAGFDMKYADKLFSPFQRLHSASEFEGTGIGLTIVHRIISKHGGRIWAEGEVGKGATFYFTLSPKKTDLQVAA